jgi:hypothetical protein
MPQNQEQTIKPTIEIQASDPKLWEKEDQDSILGFFKLLIEIDMRNKPENYKSQVNQTNLKSYEPNNHIRNTNNTSQT